MDTKVLSGLPPLERMWAEHDAADDRRIMETMEYIGKMQYAIERLEKTCEKLSQKVQEQGLHIVDLERRLAAIEQEDEEAGSRKWWWPDEKGK